jgi:hypothetical protein
MLCALVDSGDMLWLDHEVGGVWSIVEKCWVDAPESGDTLLWEQKGAGDRRITEK